MHAVAGPNAEISISGNSIMTTAKPSPLRVAVWVMLFYVAWFFDPLWNLLAEGAMSDPDDFLRLHEVQNWMQGQGWYDGSVLRMNAPFGADLHWSRLIDVPIAAIAALSGLFTAQETALRIAALVWPAIVLFATLMTLIAISERVWPSANRLVTVFFAVSNIAALTIFAPGRIDHHNVQILLVFLAVLGLISGDRKWGVPVTGFAVALSLVIGLDNLPLIGLLFASTGLAWALGLDGAGRTMRQLGIYSAVCLLALYPLVVAPSDWFTAHCDAISFVYLALTGAVALAFVVLQALPVERITASEPGRIALRIFAGTLAAGLCGILMWQAFPQCIAGPYGALSPELTTRWLSKISEAKGLIDFAQTFGWAQLAVPLYLGLLLAAGIWLRIKGTLNNAVLPVLALVAISLFLAFLQVRALRIGVFAAVPLCVVVASLIRQRIIASGQRSELLASAMTAIACLPLLTPVWLLTASLLLPSHRNEVAEEISATAPAWQSEIPVHRFCNHESDYSVLASLPAGIVFNDLGSGPPILVFTHHSVVGGNYHRNERAILDSLDFFASESSRARQIADAREADYLAYCQADPRISVAGQESETPNPLSMRQRLKSGDLPSWLEPVSPQDDRFQVYRIVR